jgi:hypothetical protein
MTTLQHLAVDALTKSGHKYDGNDLVIENVIFEVDQFRQILQVELGDCHEEYKFLQEVKNTKSWSNTTSNFNNISRKISKELFDDFSYYDVKTTDEEIEWKEYFHCIYDYLIPEDKQPFNNRVWEILPPKPPELDTNSPNRYIVNSIKHNFEKLRIEGETLKTLDDILKEQTLLGKELIFLRKEIYQLNTTMDVYDRIIKWSMH